MSLSQRLITMPWGERTFIFFHNFHKKFCQIERSRVYRIKLHIKYLTFVNDNNNRIYFQMMQRFYCLYFKQNNLKIPYSEFDIKLNYKNKGWLSFETKNLWIIILSDENRNCCQFFKCIKNDTLIFLPLNQHLFAKYTLFEILKNRLLYHFHFIPNLVPGHFVFNHLEVNFYHEIIFSLLFVTIELFIIAIL